MSHAKTPKLRDMSHAEKYRTMKEWRHRVALAHSEDWTALDESFKLCKMTGRGYHDIVFLMGQCRGNQRDITVALGYRRSNYYRLLSNDGGWWLTLARWISQYIEQWERTFMTATNDKGLALPDQNAALNNIAKALGLDAEVLAHYITHGNEIDAFLETQRGLLARIAELKLWELVSAGDPATIRWVLPRVKPETFGDRSPAPGDDNGQTPLNVRIIDV